MSATTAVEGARSDTIKFVRIYSALLLALMVAVNAIPLHQHYFQRLAEAFLQGRLDVDINPTAAIDISFFKGRFYYPEGPFFGVLLMPFLALFGSNFEPGALSAVANLLVFFLCFRIARRHEYSEDDALWIAMAFFFATSFAQAINPVFLPHSLAVLFLFLAINEYTSRRQWWLIGLFVGLAMSSRVPAGINILFFVMVVVFETAKSRDKMVRLIQLAAGFAPVVFVLAIYNYARFGNPLETGYGYQIVHIGLPYSEWMSPGNNGGPAIALSNIPGHLMIFLFGLPDQYHVSASVFFVSPFLFYLLRIRGRNLTNRLILFNCLIVLLAVLAFRSTGRNQMGYRFSLDFMPFVFWLLMRDIKPTPAFKTLVFAATIVDLALIYHAAF